MRDVAKLALLLAAVCILNGLALGLVYEASKAAIGRTAAAVRSDSLKVVLPEAARFSPPKERRLPEGGVIPYHEGYAADGALIGYVLEGSAQGYQSVLKVLVGLTPRGVIRGVKVLEQGETPGLGARCEEVAARETLWSRIRGALHGESPALPPARPWFQEQYAGLAPEDLAVLRPGRSGKGIHALTGATITSRALTAAVKESAERFLQSGAPVSND